MKSLHISSASTSSDQCDTSADWHTGMSPCQMSRLLQNESVQFHHRTYLKLISFGNKLKWFWKQAEVVNVELSLPLLVFFRTKRSSEWFKSHTRILQKGPVMLYDWC